MPTTATPLFLALLAVPAIAVAGLRAQDPLTQKALQRIAEVEGQEPALEAGDGQRANLLLNQLAWAGKRLNAVSDQTEAHWRDAKRRYDALWQKIEAKGKAGTPAPAGGGSGYDHAKLVQLDKEPGALSAGDGCGAGAGGGVGVTRGCGAPGASRSTTRR